MAGGLALLLVAFGLVNASVEQPWLRARTVKGQGESPGQHLYEGWNTYSRVTVDQTLVFPPVLWAGGRHSPLELFTPLPQRGIKIDGAAGTVMVALDRDADDGRPGTPADHAYLGWDVTAFAHHLRPTGPAAVIGVGGGRDVLEAARVGHSPVLGLELNALIVALHEGSMREFSGIAELPGVELVHDEARAYMARDPRRYDVVTMSLIDTWASTGAGAYSLSENGLYTVEGWQIFLRRLTPTGIFTVSRWYKPDSPGETARMLALAMETLWSLGVEQPRRHVMMLQSLNIATILVSPSPFTSADVNTHAARGRCARLQRAAHAAQAAAQPALARAGRAARSRGHVGVCPGAGDST
jgi:spermidine synthase